MKLRPSAPVSGFYGRSTAVLLVAFRILVVLLSLYLFIVSLSFLSLSFRLLGGKNLSSLFSSSELLSNPMVGLMIGILVTVLVQSSSTSTSIIVSLVSAGVEVSVAVPMILGSNVGTSVTNTLVSMSASSRGDPTVSSRAFAAATVHDMFNWLSVVVLLPLEMATGFLEVSTGAITDALPLGGSSGGSNGGPDLLGPLVNPLTNAVVQVDKAVLIGWSMSDPSYANVTSILIPCNSTSRCSLLGALGLGDGASGALLLGASLFLLITCLLSIMRSLNALLGSSLAIFVQRVINAEVPYVPWLSGYLAMLTGALLTILLRSSSIFTSTLTPLVGLGLVSLETAYPMTLGSNIGTTTTSMLASLAATGKYARPSLQISFVHLLFNLMGILIFYPIPAMRWPLPLARALGALTATYRWFALLYLLSMFFLLPGLVFGLSLLGKGALYGTLGPLLAAILAIILINALQRRCPRALPPVLRSWDFLPLPLRSLQPLDDFLKRYLLQYSCCRIILGPAPGEKEEESRPLEAVSPQAQAPRKQEHEEVAILPNENEFMLTTSHKCKSNSESE